MFPFSSSSSTSSSSQRLMLMGSTRGTGGSMSLSSSPFGFQTHRGSITNQFFPSYNNIISDLMQDHGNAKTAAGFQPPASGSGGGGGTSPLGLITRLDGSAHHIHGNRTRSLDNTPPLQFSVGRHQSSHDNVDSLNNMESQCQFTLGLPSMGKLVNIPEDSVPCTIRAKRGCATHPRSIAERERRKRISRKLKKLLDVVPNMDKQTSYAELLEVAAEHIKNLQTMVEKLNGELEACTCGCKSASRRHE